MASTSSENVSSKIILSLLRIIDSKYKFLLHFSKYFCGHYSAPPINAVRTNSGRSFARYKHSYAQSICKAVAYDTYDGMAFVFLLNHYILICR